MYLYQCYTAARKYVLSIITVVVVLLLLRHQPHYPRQNEK